LIPADHPIRARVSIKVLRLMPKARQAEADSRAGVRRHAIMDSWHLRFIDSMTGYVTS